MPSKGEVTVMELDRRERVIARRSAETRAVVPNVEFSAEVDMAATMAREAELKCGTTALLVRACAHALREIPRANGAYRDGRMELYSRVNIGVTIAEQGDLRDPDGVRCRPQVDAGDRAGAHPPVGARARGELDRPRARRSDVHDDGLRRIRHRDGHAADRAPQAAALAAGPVRDVPLIRDGSVVPGRRWC